MIFVRFVIFETSAKFCISVAVAYAALSVNITEHYPALYCCIFFHGNLKWCLFCHVYTSFPSISTAWVDEHIE